MSELGLSTIAQLLFQNEHSIDFARVVAELEGVLSRLQGHRVQIAWDCDDYVCFDIPGTRIQLAWSEVDRRGFQGCLSVAVGPGEQASRGYHEDMCSRLVDRIRSRFDPVAVLWCQADGSVGSDLIDELLEALPHLGMVLPDIDSVVAALTAQEARLIAGQGNVITLPLPEARALAAQIAVAAPPVSDIQTSSPQGTPALVEAANDQPDLPRQRDVELDRLRSALYDEPEQDAPYSTQMRLAVHCLNATLIVVWAPLGAALMTYSILKGEDMRLSSRMMAVAGTVFALANSPVGATVASMAMTMV